MIIVPSEEELQEAIEQQQEERPAKPKGKARRKDAEADKDNPARDFIYKPGRVYKNPVTGTEHTDL